MTPIKATRLSGGTKALAKAENIEDVGDIISGIDKRDGNTKLDTYKKRTRALLIDYKEVQLGAVDIANNTFKHIGDVKARLQASRCGRKTKYEDAWMPDKAYEILTDPTIVAPKAYVSACLGVSRNTLDQWIKDDTKPALQDSIAWGIAVQEAQLATMMRGGFKYSNNLFAILKNLHDWKDRTEETQVKIDVASIIKEIETGAPHVDWDREQVIDAEVIEATAHAKGDDELSQRTHQASPEATHAPSSEASIPADLGAS